MALKECKECGKEVSSKAGKCPNCGVSNPTTSLGTKLLKTLGGFLLLGWICYMIGTSFTTDDIKSDAERFADVSLNIRSGPSTEFDPKGALVAGEQIKVIDDSTGWINIESLESDKSGWVSKKYTSPIAEYEDWENEQNENELGSESNNSKTQKSEVNWEPVLNAVEQAKESGYLTRVENADRTVYVNPLIWRSFDAETKENSVQVFARYLGYLNDMDDAVGITVKNAQSGRTIAEYSVFSGVEIK